MENKKLKLNKMSESAVPKLLLTMSLPAIFSMLIQALYNIVDSMFVARVSESALLSVSIAFPMQMIIVAFALGIGVGTNSIVARKLGENQKDEADKFAQTGLFMAIVCSVLFLILGTFVPRLFMQAFSTNSEVIEMGTRYLTICVMGSFGVIMEMLFSKTLQATGNMMVPMVGQLIGAITNIILDPLFIFTFKMGVSGAAVATVIGQVFAMSFSMFMAIKRGRIIQIIFKKFKPQLKYFATIAKVGLPVLIMNAVNAFIILILNGILQKYSEIAISVLGVYFKLQSFVFMPVFGLMQGALPILAFNYGANKKDRYVKTMLLSTGVAVVFMSLGLLLFQLAPAPLMSIFKAKGEMLSMGIIALKRLSLCFLPAALGIVMTTGLQSIGYGFSSLIMSLLRQVILIIPSAILFGKWGGVNAVWFCYPFAEVITATIFLPLTIYFVIKAFKVKNEKVNKLQLINELENKI